MEQEHINRKRRRTNEELDSEVMSQLEKLIIQNGFGNVNQRALLKAADIEANVFYRRYGTMDNLYNRLAQRYDFWINETIRVADLNTLGPKKFFANTLKALFKSLSDNEVMQKLLLYEMSEVNETTQRAAATRDIMNMNLIAFYEQLFKAGNVNIKSVSALLIGGIYYLILHRKCAKICTIDFDSQAGVKAFEEGIDFLTDAVFGQLEALENTKKAALSMLADGLSESKICKYLSISKSELKILLQDRT